MKFPPLPPGGHGHDWVELARGPLPAEAIDSWQRFRDKYMLPVFNKTDFSPKATHWCRRCGILVSADGVRPEDEECDQLLVRLIMES